MKRKSEYTINKSATFENPVRLSFNISAFCRIVIVDVATGNNRITFAL